MTADWIAALLILGSLAVIALLIVTHLAEDSYRHDDVDTVRDLARRYCDDWDRQADDARNIAEVLARIQVARMDQGIGAMVDAVQQNQAQR